MAWYCRKKYGDCAYPVITSTTDPTATDQAAGVGQEWINTATFSTILCHLNSLFNR